MAIQTKTWNMTILEPRVHVSMEAMIFKGRRPSRATWEPHPGCWAWQHRWESSHPGFVAFCSALETVQETSMVSHLGKEGGWFSLHSSTMLQKKIHTLLAAISSSIMQRGVLVLVQSVHCSTSLKKDLGTLQLKWSSPNSLKLVSIKIPNRCNKYGNKCTHFPNKFYHLTF